MLTRVVGGLLVGYAVGSTAVRLYDGDEFRAIQALSRTLSRTTGLLMALPIPDPTLREAIYKGFSLWNDANLAEVELPAVMYPSFGDFFTRRLRKGARPAVARAQSSGEQGLLVSPVDGRMLVHGKVTAQSTLEQIKGQSFTLQEFLGPLYDEALVASPPEGKALFYCVIYLSPRDYHRIHSPAHWAVSTRALFPGLLLSVAPSFVQRVPRVFSRNERLLLAGSWPHGFFSLTAVGATNVGSISLVHEPLLRTNLPLALDQDLPAPLLRPYPLPLLAILGRELATFHLGSTVVLIFHAPSDFAFKHGPHDRVFLGDSLS